MKQEAEKQNRYRVIPVINSVAKPQFFILAKSSLNAYNKAKERFKGIQGQKEFLISRGFKNN